MNEAVFQELLAAREKREACALVTVAETRGSVPREAGAKMIVYDSGKTFGTVGGGKFESLIVEESLAALRRRTPVLKTYPLHECGPDSFGAICGGEMTVFIEPQNTEGTMVLVGAGHCAQAIADLARTCGWYIAMIDDREELLTEGSAAQAKIDHSPAEFITAHAWRGEDALILVSRNYEIDREALHAALQQDGIGYLGMIGSTRKVRRVFEELRARGVSDAALARVHAPIGLDIGADSPAEIAVSVLAEVMQVLRRRPGGPLRIGAGG